MAFGDSPVLQVAYSDQLESWNCLEFGSLGLVVATIGNR